MRTTPPGAYPMTSLDHMAAAPATDAIGLAVPRGGRCWRRDTAEATAETAQLPLEIARMGPQDARPAAAAPPAADAVDDDDDLTDIDVLLTDDDAPTPAFEAALTEIFKRFGTPRAPCGRPSCGAARRLTRSGRTAARFRPPQDVDKDGALNDAELDAFATELNGKPFPPEDKEEIRTYFQVTSSGCAAGGWPGPHVPRADARADCLDRREGNGSAAAAQGAHHQRILPDVRTADGRYGASGRRARRDICASALTPCPLPSASRSLLLQPARARRGGT